MTQHDDRQALNACEHSDGHNAQITTVNAAQQPMVSSADQTYRGRKPLGRVDFFTASINDSHAVWQMSYHYVISLHNHNKTRHSVQ